MFPSFVHASRRTAPDSFVTREFSEGWSAGGDAPWSSGVKCCHTVVWPLSHGAATMALDGLDTPQFQNSGCSALRPSALFKKCSGLSSKD